MRGVAERTSSMARKRARLRAAAFLIPVALLAATAAWVLFPRGPASDSRLLARKGVLARVDVLSSSSSGGLVTEELRIVSTSGLELRALLQRPDTSDAKMPAGILLGGLETGRECIRALPARAREVLWLSFDYPYRAPRRAPGLRALPRALREAERGIERTTAGMSLALDYLESRRDVDTTRVVIGGGSLGAFFAVMGGAIEPRFDGVFALFGGGNLHGIVARNLRVRPRALRAPIARALNPWLGPLDPAGFASRIAPRPFLMVNGAADTMIPQASVMKLWEAAAEPRDQAWVDAPHRVLREPEVVERVAGVVIDWMERRGLLAPH